MEKARSSQRTNKDMDIAAIDLFCGAGGLTYGLEQAGIRVVLGVDVNAACAYPIEANTKARFLKADVKTLSSDVLMKAWGNSKVRVLAGCAPCQPFSSYTQGRLTSDDPRWSLLYSFARLVEETIPHVVTMENVAKVSSHKVFKKFLRTLSKLEYEINWDIIDCRDCGVPQTRKRLVLMASRLNLGKPGLPNAIFSKNNLLTVYDAIRGLPPIKAGEADPRDPLHIASSLSERNLARIRASKPGGTWRDWPPELVTECHRKGSGKTFPSVYGRMEWNKPAPTMTGQCYGYGNGRFGHPEQDRAISLREAAILQSFPKEYSFTPPDEQVSLKAVGLMIGNAVPPKLAEAIGTSIIHHVKMSKGTVTVNDHV